jgi:GTP-binding protein HflX
LVGYTNAGKSTLFNKLSGSGVLAEDMLFATLDPTMRSVEAAPGKQVILSDTVGFISSLPTQLVAAFRATLEEVTNADLILHVRDISHPETAHQAANVTEILGELGIGEADAERIVEVWNKIDSLPQDQAEAAIATASRMPNVHVVSALTGQGIEALQSAIATKVSEPTFEASLRLGFDDGRKRAWLFERKLVLAEAQTDDGYEVDVRWSDRDRNRFESL